MYTCSLMEDMMQYSRQVHVRMREILCMSLNDNSFVPCKQRSHGRTERMTMPALMP